MNPRHVVGDLGVDARVALSRTAIPEAGNAELHHPINGRIAHESRATRVTLTTVPALVPGAEHQLGVVALCPVGVQALAKKRSFSQKIRNFDESSPVGDDGHVDRLQVEGLLALLHRLAPARSGGHRKRDRLIRRRYADGVDLRVGKQRQRPVLKRQTEEGHFLTPKTLQKNLPV